MHSQNPPSTGRHVTSNMSVGPERVQSTRKISSTIVGEHVLGPMPHDLPVREIEVPGPVQEVVKHVTRKEVVEVERRVPKQVIEYVDKVVEVPRIEYVDRVVEVPQEVEVIKEVKVPKYVDIPREIVKEVKVPRVRYIEQTVEVPGELIEVPKPYQVTQKVEFKRYTDRKRPVVVAQTVKPVVVEGASVTEVDVYEYEPECVPVDVHVVKAVQAQIEEGGVIETTHRVVSVPAAQYNSILRELNSHLAPAEIAKLPFMQDANRQTTFLNERINYAEPQPGAIIQGLDMNNMVSVHTDHTSRRTIDNSTDNMRTGIQPLTSYA